VSLQSLDKDPNSVLDFLVDWFAWLQVSEVITDHIVTITGSVVEDSSDHDNSTVTVWLSGGEVGEFTLVTVRVTTNQGRTEDKSFRLVIKER